MATKSDPLERVNVNLPRPLLDDLRRLVPRSRRSEVIARATARELRRLKLAALLEDSQRDPILTDAEYPALIDGAAIDAEIGRLRGQSVEPAPRSRRKARHE